MIGRSSKKKNSRDSNVCRRLSWRRNTVKSWEEVERNGS
jgi:hypothetical protein